MAKQAVTVELYYSSAWNDITSDVRVRDGITITRGRQDEQEQPPPARCHLTLDNTDGNYSPSNPTGALFGLIGRNTPIRVQIDSETRFVGEVSSWAPRESVDGNDAWVDVVASGLTRRLGQGADPLRSAPRRWITATDPAPVAYWALDDPELSLLGRATVGSELWRPLSGSTRFGSETLAPWLGTGAAIVDQSGTMLGDVVMSTSPTALVVDHIRRADAGGSGPSVLDIRGNTESGGDHWILTFTPPDTVEIQLNVDGAFAFDTSDTFTDLFDDRPHHVRFAVAESGGLAAWSIRVDGEIALEGLSGSALLTGARQVRMSYTPGSSPTPLVFGHLAVWDSEPDFEEAVDAAFGHRGETAGRRIERLCSEEGITFTSRGDLDGTIRMGPQHVDPLMDILREAARADIGVLYDAGASEPQLAYRTRESLYNQTVALELDYGEAAPPLHPALDDLATRNDVTALDRLTGGEAQAVRESGPMSVQAPPDGVGRVRDSVRLNLPSPLDLSDQAGWRLNLGTVADIRWPQVTVDLDASPALASAVSALGIGDRITIDNLPSRVTPDLADLLVQGWTERIESHRRLITLNCTPAAPWTVGKLEGVFEGFEDDEYSVETADGGDAAWGRTAVNVIHGTFSLVSGTITHDQTSDFIVTVPSGMTLLTLWWAVSSEEDFDFFEVIVDAATVFAASGLTGWSPLSIDVTGASTVTFRYSKDAADSEGIDAAWIDNLQFTGTTPDPDEPARYSPYDSVTAASFDAGTDTALSVTDNTGGNDLWTTSQDGDFDILVAGVRLRVTAIGAATGANQTMTVDQAPINGVTKTIPSGSQVQLWQPARWAL